LAADCAPILLADPYARVIAAAHAGWRGALAGIVEATISTMERAGAERARLVAAVGPCISQAAYEVGPEFVAAVLRVNPGFSKYFKIPAGLAREYFDLPGFVLGRLKAAGVGHVDNMALCTYADPARFFSYRRMTHRRETDYGRQISAIVLT
jgi:polyphenol oxidase